MQKNSYSDLGAKIYSKLHQIKNVNQEFHQQISVGQRFSDVLASVLGSWTFIIIQSVIIIVWITANVYMLTHPIGTMKAWDPYPFILLNLALSFQGAYTGPIVMMSQNRQAQKDRLMAENDFFVNVKSEEEIQLILKHLDDQNAMLLDVLEKMKKN
jgi:uncharacterized membrane protein